MRSVKFKMAEKQILTMFGAEIAHSGLLSTLLISDLFYIKHHKHHNSSRLSLAVARSRRRRAVVVEFPIVLCVPQFPYFVLVQSYVCAVKQVF
jgi:uncharacterized membrane protein